MAKKSSNSLTPHMEELGLAGLRSSLLAWYDREARDLPWRRDPSPYKTLVSEFMLQQTQVSTVLRFFDGFLKKFPSFRSLARASEEDVLAAWSGLGYYRRARSLKRAAEEIVRKHGGDLPRDPAALANLPGFGGYTAAAVGSIALSLPLAAVDGNVRRVVTRLFVIGPEDENARVREEAQKILDPARPGDWNQAMMELGATVCLPRDPRCLLCPVRESCAGFQIGKPENFPRKRELPATRAVRAVAIAAVRRGKILVLQRGDDTRFAGMWEFPSADSRDIDSQNLTPDKTLFELTRLRSRRFDPIGEADSIFTHHRITTSLYLCDSPAGTLRRQSHIASRWVNPAELMALASSKAQKRLFSLLLESLETNS
jgi:A/G-specific adenine glycosylase